MSVSWPTNVLTTTSTAARTTQANFLLAIPQAWAFFTRSPQSQSYVAYRKLPDGGWEAAGTLPQSRGENAFGLIRTQRGQPTELAILASKARFTSCEEYLRVCLKKSSSSPQAVKNPTNTEFFCGKFRLVAQYPVKWAYRNEVPELIRAASFSDVDVKCKGKS